jgi:hypothetical protein
MSWSSWGEFFHEGQNDYILGEIEATSSLLNDSDDDIGSNNNDSSYLYIDRPVFIIPIITFHPGHILVDVLEQVYGAMIKSYGRVRRDTLLVFDVAHPAEKLVLQQKLSMNSRYYHHHPTGSMIGGNGVVDDEGNPLLDTYGSSLEVLTELPMFTMDLLRYTDGTKKKLLFADVHVGLDNSVAFFNEGHRSHPCVLSDAGENDLFNKKSKQYGEFYQYIHSFYDDDNETKPRREKTSSVENSESDDDDDDASSQQLVVTIIQRAPTQQRAGEDDSLPSNVPSSNRVITNLDRLLLEIERQPRLSAQVLTLEDTPFSKQREVFRRTNILVSVAGSSLHNIMYLQPGSIVVVLMQRGWSPWSWMFANQAQLLRMPVFLYLDKSKSPDESSTVVVSHWSRRFWKQGPRGLKLVDIDVDEDVFAEMMRQSTLSLEEDRRGRRDGGKSSHGDTDHHSTQRLYDNSSIDLCFGGVPTFGPRDTSAVGTEVDDDFSSNIGAAAKSGPIVRLLISGIKTTTAIDGKTWRVSVSGSFEYASSLATSEFFSSMPHLSVCLEVVEGDQEQPLCLPIENFNYYANLKLGFSTENPIQGVHLWIQSSPMGAKLRGSDAFVSLDHRVPDGGWLLSQYMEEILGSPVPNPCNLQHMRVVVEVPDPNIGFEESLLSMQSPYAFQRDLADLCVKKQLSRELCGLIVRRVASTLHSCTVSTSLGLPMIQHHPTPDNPFVFMHIEKTGGTTLREFFTEAADRLNLSYFVPCHGNIHCTVLDPSDLYDYGQEAVLRDASIVAGHFFWGVWRQLPRWNIAHIFSWRHNDSSLKREEGEKDERENVPPCLVMGRHPVDRAISYYYQRCYQLEHCVGYQRQLNSLDRDELYRIGLNERHGQFTPLDPTNHTIIMLDEGMSDAACRSMTGRRATSGYRHNLPGKEAEEGDFHVSSNLSVPPPLTSDALYEAKNNMAKCVVGLQERWSQTQQMILHWFPWVGDFSHDPERRKMHLFSGKETRQSLRPDLREVLESINKCDIALYEEMVATFEKQMLVLQAQEQHF